ncbi:MAG TPA: hypothetical protein VNI54_13100 [Thermoanaerobaculia bacterium]|nr:hypothetical protein [Thermoanaerobaculia bacterium]
MNGFDFWALTGPNNTVVGHIDDFSISSFDAAASAAIRASRAHSLAVGTVGVESVTTGDVHGDRHGRELRAGDVRAAHVWRDGSNTIVATTPTFNAPAGRIPSSALTSE